MSEKEMTLEYAVVILGTEHIEYNNTAEEVNKACEIGRKAIQKQIPQSPEFWGDSYDEYGGIIYDNAKCRNCGNDDFEYGINNWGCAYCPNCGQALDWSGLEW